jgi:hypothetical protein
MSNKVIALLLLFNGVLVVVGNIVENKSLWLYFDIYTVLISLLAGYRLFKLRLENQIT